MKASVRTFGQVIQTAEIDGLVVRSPLLGIELPKETAREEMHFLGPDEIVTLADRLDDRFRAAIFSGAYTGLRAGELWALKLRKVNLLRRRLEVVESVSEVNGKLITGPTKTGVRRAVSLPRFLWPK